VVSAVLRPKAYAVGVILDNLSKKIMARDGDRVVCVVADDEHLRMLGILHCAARSHVGMRVGAEKSGAFQADGPITESGAFGGAGDDTYVAEHSGPVRGDRLQYARTTA
jgi:hypothetical protein